MGQRNGFSRNDLLRLNRMYNCRDSSIGGTGGPSIPQGGGTPPSKPNNNFNQALGGFISGVGSFLSGMGRPGNGK